MVGPITAKDIAAELPAMPSNVEPIGGDTWFSVPADAEHVLSAARRGWAARDSDGGFTGASFPEGGTMSLRVYDSPAARLAAEQSTPTGVYQYTTGSGVTHTGYRCFANCGPVSLKVSAESDRKELVAWADAAIVTSQASFESIFGGCPAVE